MHHRGYKNRSLVARPCLASLITICKMSVFARLYPADSTGLAHEAITSSQYFVPAQTRRMPRREERATTSPPDFDPLHYLPSCELSFAPPRTSSGILIGTDKRCDIVVRAKGVSRHHLALTFRKSLDNVYRLVCRDTSSNGTEVRYDSHGHGMRKNFEWILDDMPDFAPSRIIIALVPVTLEFLIVPCIPFRDRTSTEYVAAVQNFLQGTNDYVALLSEAALASGSETQVASQVQTPSSKSIFIKMKKLGSGSFGEVSLVWDVSTGRQYACKRPLFSSSAKIDDWRREMDMLRSVHHVRYPGVLFLSKH